MSVHQTVVTFPNLLSEPTDIVPKMLTHILYTFADTGLDNRNVILTDLYRDQQKHCEHILMLTPAPHLY